MPSLSITLENYLPWATKYLDSQGYVLYETRTDIQDGANHTVIQNDRDETIATLHWRDVLPDEIKLKGETKYQSIHGWLHKSHIPLNYDVKVKDDAGRGYIWKGNAPGLLLQLHTAEDDSTPIATFHGSVFLPREDGKDPHQPPARSLATLELTERAQEVRDFVITSFVVLEKGRQITHGVDAMRQTGAVVNASEKTNHPSARKPQSTSD
ncbi:hypothetical protein HWV62_1054 [Athelia sp. TMB]|nr:hypothetical protein HWV62_1054 [Athelia sp. TMB]